MEGSGGFFPFGGGDPEDLLGALREFAEKQAESVQDAQREQFATLTLSTAVDLTAAALGRIQVDGPSDAQALALREAVGEPPQLATPERLDAIGAATRALERELDPGGASPFAAALKSAQGAVSELQREVEAGYLVDLT